jgi:hypothetical protein
MDDVRRSIELLDQKQTDMQNQFHDELREISNSVVKQTTLLEAHFDADSEMAREITDISRSLQDINTTLAKNNVLLDKQEENLREHMKRTALLEERMEPIEDHVSMVSISIKAIIWLVGAIATVLGIVQALK